jgi:hypothetical protein
MMHNLIDLLQQIIVKTLYTGYDVISVKNKFIVRLL